IEKSLNVLLHLMAELCDHRLLQIEEIECVVPPTTIRPRDRVAIFLHQSVCQFLQSRIKVLWPVRADVHPRREQRRQADLSPGSAFSQRAYRTILLVFRRHCGPMIPQSPPCPKRMSIETSDVLCESNYEGWNDLKLRKLRP